MISDTTLSDGLILSDGTRAFASVTLSAGLTLLEGSELDADAGDAGRISRGVIDVDAGAVAARDDGMSPRGENSENDTNEPNFNDNVIGIQDNDIVGVAVNSGVDSGLDKREEQSRRAEGNEDLIWDMLSPSPMAAEILPPHLPRSQ